MKILWLTHGPHAIYTDIVDEIRRTRKDINIKLILDTKHKKSFGNNQLYVKTFDINKIIYSPLILVNWLKGRNTDIPPLQIARGLKKLLDKEKPDIVVANLFYRPSTTQIARYANKNNIPFILKTEMKRFSPGKCMKILEKIIIKCKKKVLKRAKIISPWVKDGELFGRKNFPVNKNKIKTISPGINTDLFKAKKRKKGKELKIMMLARFVPYKKHEELIKALEIVKKEGVNFEVLLIGQGPLEKKIKEKTKELKLEKEIKFVSKIEHNKMPEIYSEYDINILPSENEAIGMVIPEGMACGCVPIVSDSCGAKTYIENRKEGYVFKTNNHKKLAKAIIKLNDKKALSKMSKEAIKTIESKYSIKKIAKEFLEMTR